MTEPSLVEAVKNYLVEEEFVTRSGIHLMVAQEVEKRDTMGRRQAISQTF